MVGRSVTVRADLLTTQGQHVPVDVRLTVVGTRFTESQVAADSSYTWKVENSLGGLATVTGSVGDVSLAGVDWTVSPAYADFDAEQRWPVPGVRVADPKACQCGEVLKGVIKPWECKVFGTACTPERPIGTCMVSSEGACAAYYNYGRFAREREVV